MSYLIPAALAAALDTPPLDLKLAGLRAFVEEVLRQHDPAFRVVTYASEAVTSASSRKERVDVMGRPARYCEVLYAGDEGTFETPDDARHFVNVFVYYGVGSTSRADAEDAFRTLLESRDPASPGLLHAIRVQGGFLLQGDETDIDGDPIASAAGFEGMEVIVTPPARVQAVLAYPEDFPQDDQYECAFACTIV